MKVFTQMICWILVLSIIYLVETKTSEEEINELERLAAKAKQERMRKHAEKSPLQKVYKMYLSFAEYGHKMSKLREQARKSLCLTNSTEQKLYDELHPELSIYA